MATLDDVTRYAELASQAVGLGERIAGLFRRDPQSRARRLRNKAGRLMRRATRIARRAENPNLSIESRARKRDRATLLRRRALEAWLEAQALHPLSVTAAIAADTRV